MKVNDYNARFEATLKSNNLVYTVSEKSETMVGITISHKNFVIQPRQAWDTSLLVTLTKIQRPVSFNRLGKTTASCFVVNPDWANKRRARITKGLRGIWSIIRIQCLPL